MYKLIYDLFLFDLIWKEFIDLLLRKVLGLVEFLVNFVIFCYDFEI